VAPFEVVWCGASVAPAATLSRPCTTLVSALAEIEDYLTVNRAYRQAFAEVPNLPARLTYQAGALPFGCNVEVQAVAAHS
jgi:2-iminobutanoate/2-iminopropanoate deaminase